MTTWDESRTRIKAQQSHGTPYPIDYITQQPNHGSPYHVYPYPSPVPLQHAFQPPPYPIHSTYSPKALPKQIMELGGKQYGSPLTGSPILSRGYSLTPKGSPIPSRIYNISMQNKMQEGTITLTTDTEALVTKIGTMFPTVSETHIKILLKKYYNREAVVISALQVEKHPISTPGPFSTPPSGGSRLQAAANAALQMARGGQASSPTPPLGQSPRASPPLRPHSGSSGTFNGSPRSVSSRPHSSPKMKLRYLKSVFPKAEETLILDMLANEENNVQKASEKLVMMGYFKRDTIPQKGNHQNETKETQKPCPVPVPSITPPRLRSIEDKQALKLQLQKKYNTIPERVVSIALESVDWSQERAEQILSVVVQEDVTSKKVKESEKEIDVNVIEDIIEMPASSKVFSGVSPTSPVTPPLSNGNHFMDKTNRQRQKNRKEAIKTFKEKPPLSSFSPTLDAPNNHRSKYLMSSLGPDPNLAKGAQDQLLLVDYVTWNGANPELKCGSTSIAKGSVKAVSEEMKKNIAKGSNKDLYKGPSGLAKGSIYRHINDINSFPQAILLESEL